MGRGRGNNTTTHNDSRASLTALSWRSARALSLVLVGLVAWACTSGTITSAELREDPNTTVVSSSNEVLPPEANATLGPVFGRNALAIYWGQNSTGSEPNLMATCTTTQYNIVILSFVNVFGRNNSKNANSMPGSNFADHCETPLSAAANSVLVCPDFTPAIAACQARGKRVLISLGGAEGSYGLADINDAQQLAQSLWQMYLGGSGMVRPFGSAVLDGVDLDIESPDNSNSRIYYSSLVSTLRELMNADTKKRYAITAAPQCPYPDAYLGPGTGLALSVAPLAFDAMLVQFYNNPGCSPASTSTFTPAWQSWSALAAQSNFKIYVGLPASTGAATDASYFVPQAQLTTLLGGVDTQQTFGGVMLWDAANDSVGGGNYSMAAHGILSALP